MAPAPRRFGLVAALCTAAIVAGCVTVWQARFQGPSDAARLDPAAPFLKAHFSSGDLVVLQQWVVLDGGTELAGTGLRLDANRAVVGQGRLSVALSEVALLETNRPATLERGEILALAVMGTVTAGVGIACAANPKACFGSCPTFYAEIDGRPRLLAEGFSGSIAPVLEATDVDSLDELHPDGRPVTLTMVNEALETHSVRKVELLAVPHAPGTSVFRGGEAYFEASSVRPPADCHSASGDCLAAVSAPDSNEYLGATSETDLAEQESLEVSFPPSAGRRGVVLRARNSLLNTYVFYQALAYMGSRAAEWWMLLERGGPEVRQRFEVLGGLLGPIELDIEQGGAWIPFGKFEEIGPIAKDTELFPLPPSVPPGPVRVRLRMTRGNWKIDWLGLAQVEGSATPRIVSLLSVEREGHAENRALAALRSGESHLLTFPGDRYQLRFAAVPPHHDLFLRSQGFYTEWMREEWLAEEDPERAAQLFLHPGKALKDMAPRYKAVEGQMESVFWTSRFGQ